MEKLKMEQVKFKVGDIVTAFGVSGVVIKIYDIETEDYPIRVYVDKDFADCDDFDDENIEVFTMDGRWKTWHKEPSLKLSVSNV